MTNIAYRSIIAASAMLFASSLNGATISGEAKGLAGYIMQADGPTSMPVTSTDKFGGVLKNGDDLGLWFKYDSKNQGVTSHSLSGGVSKAGFEVKDVSYGVRFGSEELTVVGGSLRYGAETSESGFVGTVYLGKPFGSYFYQMMFMSSNPKVEEWDSLNFDWRGLSSISYSMRKIAGPMSSTFAFGPIREVSIKTSVPETSSFIVLISAFMFVLGFSKCTKQKVG
jgi:hypothetical protein